MVTKLAPLFSKGADDWATPHDLYSTLDDEFSFSLDAAADHTSEKCLRWFGPGSDEAEDALAVRWDNPPYPETVWLNPPYSRCREFIAKAATEAQEGRATVVCLVPARTDTRWFQDHIWDERWHRTRPGVEVRFLKGRVKFGGASNGAPFPSMVVIFRRWCQ